MTTECQVRLDPLLEGSRPELGEMGRRATGRLVGEVGERRAAPERQGFGEALGRDLGLRAAGVLDEPPEAVEVELADAAVAPDLGVGRRQRDSLEVGQFDHGHRTGILLPG